MGESAGSFDAVAIAASPLGEGLFARVAAQTEAYWPLRGEGTIPDAEAIGTRVAEAVGCADALSTLDCLRAVPAHDLVVAAGPGDVAPWVGGHVLAAPPLDLIRADTTPIPMLVGSNREEAAFWWAPEDLPPGDDYTYFDRVHDTNTLVGPQRGRRLRDLYPVEDYDSAYWASVAAFSDAIYTCPMRRLALANNAPVYRYLYTHVYETVPDPIIVAARASHFFDDPILWKDTSLLFGIPFEFSANEEILADRMADYWTNFAKTGNPSGPGVEPWAPFTAATENIKVLDEPPDDLVGYHNTECAYFDQVPHLHAPARAFTPLRRGTMVEAGLPGPAAEPNQ